LAASKSSIGATCWTVAHFLPPEFFFIEKGGKKGDINIH